ncbi:MAG: glycosyltransferase family 2 protein [Ruminococcus sp.]|nr:glycosyltransferase family 2 protein [Ruminococcus sp.]
MKKEAASYDWTAYYKAAYEKEKKQNTATAGKIADAEAREAEASFRLERIHNNALWKLSAPMRKCYHALAGRRNGSEAESPAGNTGTEIRADSLREEGLYYQAYAEEVFRQKHPYLQWIASQEGSVKGTLKELSRGTRAEKNAAGRYIEGYRKIEIRNTDLYVITCGRGLINTKISGKVKSLFNNNDDYLFAYADEDYYWEDLSRRMHPWFKPGWSPDTLLSFCYVGHMLIVRRPVYDELIAQEKLSPLSYADFYDLVLRLAEKAAESRKKIGHIEEVLFHNRYEADSMGQKRIEDARQNGEDVLEVVEELLGRELEQGKHMPGADASYLPVRRAALQRRGIHAHFVSGQYPDVYHVVYDMPKRGIALLQAEAGNTEARRSNMISVVIPSKDHPDILERCLSSFRERTSYDNYEWIVVDNGSNDENKKRMEALHDEYGFLYLYQPMEFNFSAMCNLGAARAQGEYLLLLNDDIEILHSDWLHIMAGAAAQPHIGAVGAKLWYAGGSLIQHVGITNMQIGPSHKLVTYPDDKNYYYGRNQVTYDMIGVTAACLMIEKRKFMEVGGLDESMKISYNDVDFCYKLNQAGYFNVLRNDAVLYHHESFSRGLDEEDDGKWERLLLEKERLYKKHPGMEGKDIFYHNSLIDNASHYACNFKFNHEDNLKTITPHFENAGNLAGMMEGFLQLNVDRAEEQHKIHREEPDIMWIMGWCYIPGQDNAKYERNIVLEHENGTCCRASVFPWFRRDAIAVLSGQVNISLSGFVVRIKKEKLQSGLWRVGMIATDSDSGQSYLTWSDKKMSVK